MPADHSASIKGGGPTPETGIRLAEKVAVVTGAGSADIDSSAIGTGAAAARLLAKAGAVVMVLDRDEAAADRTVAAILAEGGRAQAVVADVAQEDDCLHAVETIVTAHRGVDILVNNAAVTSGVSVADMTEEEWRRVLDVNLKGALTMSKFSVESMASRGGGAIVNVASVAALRGFSTPAYAAAKGGLLALTVDMAGSHGPHGIRVNAIVPGHVYTPMVHRSDDTARGRELRRKAGPLGTEGTGWDVGWAILFLAGPESRWITGVALPVDAGLLASAPLPMLASLKAVGNE